MSLLPSDSATAPGAATQPQGEADTMVGAGATAHDPERLIRGTHIGHFEIERVLGRGGMGVVYAAHDTKLDRRVAIKLVLGEIAGSVGSDRRIRLEREARALARLSHPNVVQVFEIGEHEGQLFIVMEYVDGTTLARQLEKLAGPERWRDVVGLLLPAGEGLVAAHEAGLVHRDFKPDNVLVERTGRVRVMDFGVAHASETLALTDVATASTAANLALTQTGALVGTPAYMSPEQFRGAQVDARSDQFAYCVVLYEALFGCRPFGGTTVAELLAKVLEGPDPSFDAAPCPAAIVDALRRGLARDPARRFASMRELLDALSPTLRGSDRAAPSGGRRLMGVLLGFAAVGAATLVAVRDQDPDLGAVPVAAEGSREAPPNAAGSAPAKPIPTPPATPGGPPATAGAPEGAPDRTAPKTSAGGTGSLPREKIREVVRANIADVRACYEDALRQDPGASGEVLIAAEIGDAGNVESARVAESTLADAFLGSCIAGKMMSWRFPAPVGGRVTITYPFILEPG